MSEATRTISPLRRRMIEDMTLRKLGAKTQAAYIRAVKNFTRFFGQSPDAASAEDLRRYQLYLVQQNTSRTTVNATLTGLRFFFEITLDRPGAMKHTSHVHQPRKLPVILSVEEITKLLQAAGSLKYQAALGIAYGAGLRASEVVHLTVRDIDSRRMVIRVEQGKGHRDRYAMLSPALLALLRAWWREGQAQRQVLPGGWLFPGQNPVDHLSTRQLNRAFHRALDAAEINKRVTLHGLRHAFATHLLEQREDIRVIQVLLGHQKLDNTARYTQVATKTLREVKGPLEYLDLQPTG
jgi:site-specific recombinase XerD